MIVIIFVENSYGNTPLFEAIRTENIELIDLLLQRGASTTHQNHKGSTSLHILCYNETASKDLLVRIARELIRNGAMVNVRDRRGMTPFLVCCASGR